MGDLHDLAFAYTFLVSIVVVGAFELWRFRFDAIYNITAGILFMIDDIPENMMTIHMFTMLVLIIRGAIRVWYTNFEFAIVWRIPLTFLDFSFLTLLPMMMYGTFHIVLDTIQHLSSIDAAE